MRAHIVVDLGFGDSGKGLLTDFLVRQLHAGVVVRYNGGAQAGHNVVTPDGRHHTFSQFGSGTFNPQVKTFLSRHVVIHPGALLVEGDILAGQGVADPFSRLRVSEQALVITPFHQAANHIRELVRGADRHGSCGVGVGEAVEDALAHPENRVLASDLNNPVLLKQKLQIIREQKRDQMETLCKDVGFGPLIAREYELFEDGAVIDAWISSIERINAFGLVASDSVLEHWLNETEDVIFEGAQGVLLDAEAGFHPYTTWSNCSTDNAHELINEMAPDASVFKIGVMRAYAMRHGPGPLPTETNELSSVVSEHNQHNEWQGAVRYGWFDAVLARYALRVTGGVDSLLVTHLDVLSRLKAWQYCQRYQGFNDSYFNFPGNLSLEERTQFTQTLSSAMPVLESCDADDETVIQKIEWLTEQPINIISRGPRAEDIQLLKSFPKS